MLTGRTGDGEGIAVGAVLLRYVVAAALVRAASTGAAVALVALAVDATGPGGNGPAVGGLLAAMLTAPTLLGPVCARPLDRACDGRWVLAASCVLFAGALAVGAVLVGRAPVGVAAAVIGVAGLTTPLLTGGLSSRLSALADPEVDAQRRAEGWDAVTYGLAGTAGPAAVGAIVAVATPLASVVGLACAALVGAALLTTLPLPRPSGGDAPAAGPGRVVRLVAAPGPLRRVLVASTLTAVAAGGLLVVAVVLGGELTTAAGAGPALAAAFGLGGLGASAVVAVLPLRAEPERLTIRLTAVLAVAIAGCALAPGFGSALVAFGVAGAVNGVLFPASLAARSTYSPPEARAGVFVTMAGAKTAAASAGTAVTGIALALGPRAVLACSAAVVAVAAVAAVLDRRAAPGPPAPAQTSTPWHAR
ncbi:hypothetical protein FB558_1901 [Pseudonocardia kunmingensis]|uniref:MFS transporter n=2 Tax=Pseudonocardia kunmingensis TaxID=630975 RepID=A0A543E0U5_9PSEU|nr:hypothetical protein FB558_1901 [Pseudonocardia kunmingensis]